MIKTDRYVLFENCSRYQEQIELAYDMIVDNYDIVESWFSVRGRKGKAFEHTECYYSLGLPQTCSRYFSPNVC